MMLTLLAVLAVAYIVLKVLNTRAKFEEADRKRAADAEEAAELDEIRNSAVDVEEIDDADAGEIIDAEDAEVIEDAADTE